MNQLASLSLDAEKHKTDAEMEKLLDDLNQAFCSLCEKFAEWDLLEEAQPVNYLTMFRETQRKFHHAGRLLLRKLQPVVMPPAADQQSSASQLKFGDGNISGTGNPSTDKTDGKPLTTESQPVEPMLIDSDDPNLNHPKSASKQVNQTNVGGQSTGGPAPPPLVTMEQLNAAVKSACEKDQQRTVDFDTITYDLHAQLFADMFELKPQTQLNPKEIVKIVQAIEAVTDNVKSMGFRLSTIMVRMMVMHVMSIVDPQSRDCWGYHIGFDEPTVERLLNFLVGRKIKAEAEFKKYKIPQVDKQKSEHQSRSPAPSTSKKS